MDKYLENGQEIFTTYCSSTENRPVMLPRAPEQTYIDLYPETEEKAFTADIQRQSNYEAEVIVYRALERLKEKLIVLHNFEYTHHQYRLCDSKHVRKGCSKCKGKNAANKEGECDFLVVGLNFFVIIEVKDMHHLGLTDVEYQIDNPESSASKHVGALNGTFHKSLKQRKRMAELIQSIDQNVEVLHFTAYPNFSKEYKMEFQLSEKELASIIFKEDLIDLSSKENSEYSSPVADVWEEETTNQAYPNGCEYVQKNKGYMVQESTMVYGTDDDLTVDEIFEANEESNVLRGTDSEDEISEDESSRKEWTPSTSDESEPDDDDLQINVLPKSFGEWWGRNVNSATGTDEYVREASDAHIKARNMLLAMWCTDKDKFVRDKCSLSKCVLEIDQKLRSGQFTFRKTNPNVVPAPNVIKEYVGVMNLTSQQNDLFTSSENFLWINGPAGSGKTVLLCGKIIQIAKSNKQERIILFRFCGNDNEDSIYENALKNADVEYSLIHEVSEDTHPPPDLDSMLRDENAGFSDVIIIQVTGHVTLTWLTETLQLLRNCHVFVDDIQIVMEYDLNREQYEDLITLLIEIGGSKTVHVACDIVQFWYANDDRVIFYLANYLREKYGYLGILSKNLRNTCDLSGILSRIRSKFIGFFSRSPGLQKKSWDAIDMVLPDQIAGHYIHGPKTEVHVLTDRDFDRIKYILFKQLDELCSTNALGNSAISIVCDNVDQNFLTRLSEEVKGKYYDNISKIREAADCMSAEWPVVIILQESRILSKKPDNLVSLYLQMSRARVFCFVILFPEQGKQLKSRGLFGILEDLAECAHIVFH